MGVTAADRNKCQHRCHSPASVKVTSQIIEVIVTLYFRKKYLTDCFIEQDDATREC